MFQYHYLGPDDWVDAARKQTKFPNYASVYIRDLHKIPTKITLENLTA